MKHREKVDALLSLSKARARVQHVVDVTGHYDKPETEHRKLLRWALDETRDLEQLLYSEVAGAKVKR